MIKKKGLGSRLGALFGLSSRGDEFYEELEDILIEGDLGARVAAEVVEELAGRAKSRRLKGEKETLQELKQILSEALSVSPLLPEPGKLNVFLILGVNGVGKTTTIAKLAEYYRRHRGVERIVLSAGDTFRAAAIDQLKVWASRLNINVISQPPGSDPGAVIFDTIASARARGSELILADTAGRMHTKQDLVRELSKIDRVIQGQIGDGFYQKVLIIDATTGQNALSQAEVFNEVIGIDSAVLAKYDSTAKGGIAVPICKNLKIPFSFMGTGEKMTDLAAFDRDVYLDALLGST